MFGDCFRHDICHFFTQPNFQVMHFTSQLCIICEIVHSRPISVNALASGIWASLAKILHCRRHCWHWQISPLECLNYERNLRIWIRAPEVLFRGPEDGHFRVIFSSSWIYNWPNGLFWTLKCDTYSRGMHVRVKVWYWKAFLASCEVSEFCVKHNYCADLPSRGQDFAFSNVMWTWAKIVDGLHISASYHL